MTTVYSKLNNSSGLASEGDSETRIEINYYGELVQEGIEEKDYVTLKRITGVTYKCGVPQGLISGHFYNYLSKVNRILSDR